MLINNLKKRWQSLSFIVVVFCMYAVTFFFEKESRGYIRKIEILFLLCIVVFGIIVVCIPQKWKDNYLKQIIQRILDNRYWICAGIFAILVLLQISGSSINMLDAYTGEATNTGNTSRLLIGSPQAVRSDEWVVNTEYHIAQVNEEKFFPIVNQNIGMDGQNMLLACNSPVWHISLIGKPQTWGYILFGAGCGIAWFWWFRFFALLLGSFEVGQILTDKNRKISVFLMLLIGFSPIMTWWYSTTLVDLVIAGQWLFVSFYHFLFQKENNKKYKFAIIFVMSAIAYCVSLYPAIQIPLGYLLLILMLYYLIHKRKEIVWNKKTTGVAIIAIGIILAVMTFFIKDTYQDILRVMGTAYPGKRELITGNYPLSTIFCYLLSFVLPFRDITFSNSSEISMFTMFLPAVLVMFIYFIKENGIKTKKASLLCGLFLYSGLLVSMYVVVYPKQLLKITLLSYTTISRNMLVVGLAVLYALVIMLSNMEENHSLFSEKGKIIVGLLTFGFYIFAMQKFGGNTYLPWSLMCLCCITFVIFEQLILSNRQDDLLIATVITVVIASLCINPVTVTADSVTNSELVQTVKQIDSQTKGNWLVTDTMVQQNLLAANGVHTVNAVQYEPNMDYWKKLDKNGAYEDIYNRYAHITINLTEQEETKFELRQNDWIEVQLAQKDVQKASIDYIVATQEVEWDQVQLLTKVHNNYYIYRVKDE